MEPTKEFFYEEWNATETTAEAIEAKGMGLLRECGDNIAIGEAHSAPLQPNSNIWATKIPYTVLKHRKQEIADKPWSSNDTTPEAAELELRSEIMDKDPEAVINEVRVFHIGPKETDMGTRIYYNRNY